MALVLAMVMVLSMSSMAVFAEGEGEGGAGEGGSTPAVTKDYDYPLTVTGLTTGDVAHFYQVIQWVGETSDHSDVSGWKAVAPFDTYLTKERLTAILVGTKAVPAVTDPETGEVTTPAVAAVDPTGITSEIAGELAKLAS